MKLLLKDKRILFLIIWFIYDIVALLWVKDYIRWLKSLAFIGLGLLSAIIFSVILNNEEDYIKVFKTIEYASIVYNIFGWYEVITGNYLFYQPQKPYILDIWKSMNKRIPVFIGSNENEYAIVLVLMFFASFIVSKHRKYRFISILIMISDLILIYLTNSRGSIMAMIFGITMLMWMYYKNFAKDTKNMHIRIVSVVSIFGMGLIFIYLWTSNKISLQFGEGKSDLYRITLILTGLKFLLETYLIGVGGGNIEYWMYHYAPEVSKGKYANIHSWWAEILVSYGVGIFVLYLIYYFGMLLELINRTKTEVSKVKKDINNGIIAYMVAFIITSMISSSFLSKEWSWLFWGIVVGYLFNYEDMSYGIALNNLSN
jgi:teichuronic acid biosynthesis protein TuaE